MHTPVMDKSTHRLNVGGAGGRLKQRLAQLLVRSSCTTNTTKTATSSATAFVGLNKANGASPYQEEPPHSPYSCTPCVYERPKLEEGSRSHLGRRSASLARFSVDCPRGDAASSGRHSMHSDALLPSSLLPANDAKKQSKSRGKPRSSSASWRHDSYSFRGHARRPKRTSALYSSSSSTETDDELAPYSADDGSGEEAETRTLFSLLSFSSDSTSEFYHTNSSNVFARKSRKNAPRRAPRRASPRTSDPGEPMAFRPLLSAARKHHECNDCRKKEGPIKKLGTEAVCSGMAVVKRSSNPYADFVSSMVEMVVGRRIASVGKMEELLGSYLSFNSPEHHPAILAAFEDVRETVFGEVCS